MKDLVIGNKRISELEQTLIKNLKVYRDIINRINSIQPKLCLTSVLKKNICWVLGLLEYAKQDGKLIDYKIGWVKNTLRIICVNSRKEIMLIIVNLIRNRLFHENFTNNIQVRVIGVRNGQL